MDEPNLFERAAIEDLNDSIVKCTEQVIIRKTFWLMTDEGTLDLTDMYTCMLHVVEEDNIVLTDRKQIAFLKKIGALESPGSHGWCSSATAGPNAKRFLDFCVKNNVERDHDD